MPETLSPVPTPHRPDSTTEGPAGGSSVRWWLAVAAGTVAAIPVGWLLSYGASLLFLLGLFFFVLFGLLLGAVVYRVAARGRPYSRWSVLAGTTVIVGACWGIALAKELHDVPSDLAKDILRGSRDLGGRPPAEFREDVTGQIRRFLEERYPPGGLFGTMRWIVASGELRATDVPAVPRTMRREQSGTWWAIRVALSIAMLGFGVGSQTFGLREPKTSNVDRTLATNS